MTKEIDLKRLLKNAKVFLDGGFVQRDIATGDGRIVSFESGDFDVESDFTDCIVLPGFADVHVHLREPGFFYKESILTGTRAAARGGYTVVCAMPNLDPPPDNLENLRKQLDIIKNDACIEVVPYGCLTRGRGGRAPADIKEMAPFVAGFTDDGSGLADSGLMREVMQMAKAADKIVAAHCECDWLVSGGYVNECDYARRNGHKGISNASEYEMVERDLRLAKETGAKYHVCHISTKESAALVRAAKADGVDVTCETAPHYLLLDDNCLREDGRFKMNPPLRSQADREALCLALSDGTIDMIATDHAPHSAAEKSRGLKASPMGVVGLETAFPTLFSGLVKRGLLTLERLVEVMCVTPRKRFGLKGGSLKTGENADLTVISLTNPFEIRPEDFLSKGKSTPFAGETVYGKILLTLKNGRTVWEDITTEN